MDVLRPKVPAGSIARTPTANGCAVPTQKQKPAEPTAPHTHTPAPAPAAPVDNMPLAGDPTPEQSPEQ